MQIEGGGGKTAADDGFARWLQQEWPRWERWGWHHGSQVRHLGLSAEDLAQELAIVALLMKARLEPMMASARRAYMKCVALHFVKRKMQSLHRLMSLDEAAEVADRRPEANGPEDGGPLDKAGVRILDAMGRLSPLQRKAIHVRFVLELSARDAAARLGTTPQTVDTAVAKAKRRLASFIGRELVPGAMIPGQIAPSAGFKQV